jgi:peptidoglycan/LPS O-acetylase OafA/YrhL
MASNKRITELDSLRGLAALGVVLFHFTAKYRQEFGHAFSSNWDFATGHYGVDLFFIISGFVIFFSLEKCRDAQDFMVKRFSKLYPTYWVCVILTYSMVSIFGLSAGRTVSLPIAIINLSMLQGLVKLPHVDGAYWSLLRELLFYGMMLVVFMTKKMGQILWIGAAWLLVAFGSSLVTLPIDVVIWLNLSYAGLFFAGIVFYKIWEGKRTVLHYGLIFLCLALNLWFHHTKPEGMVATLIIFSIMGLFAHGFLAFIAVRPLLFLGQISYALYLLHQNIGFIIIRALQAKGYTSVVTLLIPIAVSIVLAYLITEYVEKPSIKWLRERFWVKKSAVDSYKPVLS